MISLTRIRTELSESSRSLLQECPANLIYDHSNSEDREGEMTGWNVLGQFRVFRE
jgi:hypothetical protein